MSVTCIIKMPKAYNLLLKVLSAEIKYEKDQMVGKEPYCVIQYGKYRFQTKSKTEGDEKTPKWKDEFDITYYEKVGLTFTLFDIDEKTKAPRELGKGELDLSKKTGSDAEAEVALKNGKDAKKVGILKISLKWLGDFELTPYRMELVIHTVDVSRIENFRKIGNFKVHVQYCLTQAELNDTTSHDTKETIPDGHGHLVFKERFKSIITTQEFVTFSLKNDYLAEDLPNPLSVQLNIESLRRIKPGTLKKYILESKETSQLQLSSTKSQPDVMDDKPLKGILFLRR